MDEDQGEDGLRLLNTQQLARETGIPARTWVNYRTRGGGPPYVKIGDARCARVYYRPAEVRAWIANRERASTTVG